MPAFIHVETFESRDMLLHSVESVLRDELRTRSEIPRAVLISGGQSPLPIYARIAAAPSFVCAKVHVGYSDERHVPEEAPESNYGNSKAMLNALRMLPGQVLRVHTELPLEAAADRYHDDWAGFLDAGGEISLALLGIGPDGHTCSLFTQADLERGAGRYASATYRDPGPNRVTVTPKFLALAHRIVFLAAGRDKDPVVNQLIRDPSSLTAGRAVAACARVEIWRA